MLHVAGVCTVTSALHVRIRAHTRAHRRASGTRSVTIFSKPDFVAKHQYSMDETQNH